MAENEAPRVVELVSWMRSGVWVLDDGDTGARQKVMNEVADLLERQPIIDDVTRERWDRLLNDHRMAVYLEHCETEWETKMAAELRALWEASK